MPTFDTPEPISAMVELVVGDVRITASDRDDTVVEVRPSDESHERRRARRRADPGRVRRRPAPRQTPKQRSLSLFGKPGSIDVTIELPTGSQVHGDASVAAFRLRRPSRRVPGQDSRRRHPARADRPARGEHRRRRHRGGPGGGPGRGQHRVRPGAAGRDRRHSRDQELQRRQLDRRGRRRPAGQRGQRRHLRRPRGRRRQRQHRQRRRPGRRRHPRLGLTQDRLGEIEVGIRAGTAARLDVHTQFGRVHNQLDVTDGPGPSDQTVEVRARTSYGDIVIRRA